MKSPRSLRQTTLPVSAFNATNLVLAREPLLADLWRRGREDRASLDESERIQFDMFQLSVFRIFETIFLSKPGGYWGTTAARGRGAWAPFGAHHLSGHPSVVA